MGISDTIPGVSGGTIAFITGIYERLIKSVDELRLVVRHPRSFFHLDFPFLLPLVFGVGLAIIATSGLVRFLLVRFPVSTLSFFVGLILASSVPIYRSIKRHDLRTMVFVLPGLFFGVGLAFIVPANLSPSLFYVFSGGFLAISAMFLPGISGSFILLVMGLYEYVIDALHSFDVRTVFVFLLGAFGGMIAISRLITFLFRVAKNQSLYFLLGLVLGALSVPVRGVLEVGFSWFSLLFFLLGVCVVFLLSFFGDR